MGHIAFYKSGIEGPQEIVQSVRITPNEAKVINSNLPSPSYAVMSKKEWD
jgi:hypothetical protein